LQNVVGHPVMSAGLILSSRGVGTFFAMMTIRSSMRYVEARTTLMTGLAITACTLYVMSGFTNDTSATTIFMLGVVQGFAFGMVFVSVNTVAFLTLPDHLRTYGASFQTLVRNIASSFGISIVISQLTETARRERADLGNFVTPFNNNLQMPNVTGVIDLSTDSGRALVDQILNMQALIMAYAHDFQLLTIFAICALPVAFIIGPTKATFLKATRVPPPVAPKPPQAPQSEPAE
jgi:DHA2 family multidrug resistance protein